MNIIEKAKGHPKQPSSTKFELYWGSTDRNVICSFQKVNGRIKSVVIYQHAEPDLDNKKVEELVRDYLKTQYGLVEFQIQVGKGRY